MKIIEKGSLPTEWSVQTSCLDCSSILEYDTTDFFPRTPEQVNAEAARIRDGSAVFVTEHCPVCTGTITIIIPPLIYKIFQVESGGVEVSEKDASLRAERQKRLEAEEASKLEEVISIPEPALSMFMSEEDLTVIGGEF